MMMIRVFGAVCSQYIANKIKLMSEQNIEKTEILKFTISDLFMTCKGSSGKIQSNKKSIEIDKHEK